jgi:hypothetical protein
MIECIFQLFVLVVKCLYFVGLMGRFVANYCQCFGSVLFDPDPDSAFWAEYRSGSRALMTQKKITAEKKLNIY